MDWRVLYFDKKLFSVQNKGTSWEKLIVQMPAGEYEKYHIEHSSGNGHIDTNYAWIRYPEDFVFSLITTIREPGVRYKRPKLTVAEFEAIFQEMNDKLQRRDNLWLAEVMEYDYDRHGIERSRIRKYVVGSLDGCWFYLDTDTKKLVSSKTFRIIKPMTHDEAECFNQLMASIQRLEREMRDIKVYTEKVQYEMRRRLDKPCDDIAAAESLLFARCEQRIKELELDIAKTEASFFAGIEEYLSETPQEAQEEINRVNTKKRRVPAFKKIEPLEILKESEKAVQVGDGVWLPRVWVQLSEDGKSVVAATKQALNKISA